MIPRDGMVGAPLVGAHVGQENGQAQGLPLRDWLDDAVMDTQQAWAASLRRTRHIGDFRNWKDHDAYKVAFDRLLRALKAEKLVAPTFVSQKACGTFRVMRMFGVLPEPNNQGTSRGVPIRSGLRATDLKLE